MTLPHSQTKTPTSLQRKADVETACRTERSFPMVRHFGESAAVREYLCGVIRQRGLHHRHKWARRTSEDCHKGERRSGQRGKRSREYDRSTKSDRQIASTTKPRLRQCVTARQRPHFTLYQSQQPERCRRKAALKFSYYITNRYFCKRKICPHKKKHTSAIKNHIYVVLYGGLIWVMQLIYLCIN